MFLQLDPVIDPEFLPNMFPINLQFKILIFLQFLPIIPPQFGLSIVPMNVQFLMTTFLEFSSKIPPPPTFEIEFFEITVKFIILMPWLVENIAPILVTVITLLLPLNV